MDQVIVSTIEKEKDNASSISDIAACWADICNKFFINETVTKNLQVFEANFLNTLEHGVASAKLKFLPQMHHRDLILIDTRDEW